MDTNNLKYYYLEFSLSIPKHVFTLQFAPFDWGLRNDSFVSHPFEDYAFVFGPFGFFYTSSRKS